MHEPDRHRQLRTDRAGAPQAVRLPRAITVADLREFEQRLTIRMGGMLVALAGFLAIIRFFA